jgi:hypothetical protein
MNSAQTAAGDIPPDRSKLRYDKPSGSLFMALFACSNMVQLFFWIGVAMATSEAKRWANETWGKAKANLPDISPAGHALFNC